MTAQLDAPALDVAKCSAEFAGKVAADQAAAYNAILVYLGDRVGLWRAMADVGRPASGISPKGPVSRRDTSRNGCPPRRPTATWPTTEPRIRSPVGRGGCRTRRRGEHGGDDVRVRAIAAVWAESTDSPRVHHR